MSSAGITPVATQVGVSIHGSTRRPAACARLPWFRSSRNLDPAERLKVLDAFLRTHLPREDYVHLSLKMVLTLDEYEHTDWMPEEAELVLAAR